MNTINNKKGSAILWAVLMTVILTILLGAVSTAAYVYFNYTMYSIQRQQAYFTARSAVNVILENYSSMEQERSTEGSSATQPITINGVTYNAKINFDGNYILDYYNASGAAGSSDGKEDVIEYNGKIVYNGTSIDNAGYLIEDYKKRVIDYRHVKIGKLEFDVPIGTHKEDVTKRDKLVKKAVTKSSATYTSSSSNIALLPDRNKTVTISDFGFDPSMGEVTATITRNDQDEVTATVTAYYPDSVNGQKYELKTTIVRQPLYFGGIAVKNLNLTGNLTLGENTDFYWNNSDNFKLTENGNGSSLKVAKNSTLKVNGNLVTKGDATISKGTKVAGKTFTDNFAYTKTGVNRTIWNASQYIITNKTLSVGETNISYESVGFFSGVENLFDTTPVYCNSRGNDSFGGYTAELGDKVQIDKVLKFFDLSDMADDIAGEYYKVDSWGLNSMNIQYIQVLSLSTSISNKIAEQARSESFFLSLAGAGLTEIYNKYVNELIYDTLDVSYIDFTSTDTFNKSDEVVPLAYLFVGGGTNSGETVRIRYGSKPNSKSGMIKSIDKFVSGATSALTSAFNISNSPSYINVYLEENATIHLGWDNTAGKTKQTFASDPATRIFYMSIYGGAGTTVYLHDGVILIGEIACENLVTDGDVTIIYSSENGAQVARQKVAEYWAAGNYTNNLSAKLAS